jgi:hypothetical protein
MSASNIRRRLSATKPTLSKKLAILLPGMIVLARDLCGKVKWYEAMLIFVAARYFYCAGATSRRTGTVKIGGGK